VTEAPPPAELARTPLHDVHEALGGRMVPFAGYSMPVQYASIVEEHTAVRERAGLFDVSHMGQLHLSGPDALANAERLLTCRVDTLAVGAVRYGLLCNERGGVVDDVTVYRTADDALFLCVNAANVAKDREWVQSHLEGDVALEDRSADTGMLALQGPAAPEILAACGGGEAAALRRFRFLRTRVAGVDALVSSTGYTGAPGFELYVAAGALRTLFDALLYAGRDAGLQPCGLGARDTLRLEAAMALYGHELDDETSPLEAGLERFVKRDRGGFIGAEAIEARAARPERALVGFELLDRGVARADHPILADDREVGRVTSGAPSPTLGKSIGLGYVPPSMASVGAEIHIRVRSRVLAARIVETPFVR